MARPASSIAVTLLITLSILLLPAPASSQAAAALGGLVRVPAVRQFGYRVLKDAAAQGGEDLLKQAFASGSANDDKLLGSAAADNGAYIVYSVSIGPSAAQQTFYGILDILNAFTWVSCPPQSPPPPFHSLPCESHTCLGALNGNAANCDGRVAGGGECLYVYGSPDSGMNTTGYLALESSTVGGGSGTIVGDVLFGCSSQTIVTGGNYGVIGFNKGSFSIISQLRISRFSYFLTPDDSSTAYARNVVLLGAQAVPQTTTRSRSTPLFGSKAYPDLYYVQLVGIQVDGVWLPGVAAGAFDLAADGKSGGVVLSTTSLVTYVQANAYYALRQALVSKIASVQVQSSTSFDLCYYTNSVANLKFPKITLVFGGPGSPAMELTTVHYFYKDDATGLQCLTILPTPDDTAFGSILGTMLQAGTNMIYDTALGQLTFETGDTATVPVPSQLVIASLLLVWVLLF